MQVPPFNRIPAVRIFVKSFLVITEMKSGYLVLYGAAAMYWDKASTITTSPT